MRNETLDYLRCNPVRFCYGWWNEIGSSRAPMHRHDTIEIVYHVRGRGTTTLETGRTIEFGPGSVVIYGRRVGHDQRMTARGADACVLVDLAPSAPGSIDRTCYVPPIRDRYLRDELISLTRVRPAASSRADQAVLDHRATAVLIRLLEGARGVERSRPPQPGERYATAAYERIRRDFATIRRVEDLAESVGVSYHYLRHAFVRRYGIGLRQWLIDVRLTEGKQLLVHSPLPQKAIAQLCGFATERYFSAVFLKVVGCTPGGFRRARRGSAALPA